MTGTKDWSWQAYMMQDKKDKRGKDKNHPQRGRHQVDPGRGYSGLSSTPYTIHDMHEKYTCIYIFREVGLMEKKKVKKDPRCHWCRNETQQ